MTRAEILKISKPILFNTEMVQAILDNLKTVTRRVVKPQPVMYGFLETCFDWSNVKAPYSPGDILYVRETFCGWNLPIFGMKYCYKATDPNGNRAPTGQDPDDDWEVRPWRPSIHMPKEAARLFLRVTNVRVERLQDITEEQAKAEGAVKAYPYTDPITRKTVFAESKYGTYLAGFECLWNMCYAAPRGVKNGSGVITHYESYPFEEIRETRTYKGKPWYVIGNPWVWGYEFEKMEAEK